MNNNYSRSERRSAKKIWRVMNDPKHTTQQLQYAVPTNGEITRVIGCLTDLLQTMVDEERIANKQFRDCICDIISSLKGCIKDGIKSEKERDAIIKTLDSTINIYSNVETTRINEIWKTIRYYGAYCLIGLISILGYMSIKNTKHKH